MSGTPLILSTDICQKIQRLKALAERRQVDIAVLQVSIETPEGKAEHKALMTEQSVFIPLAYYATFSVEFNHPGGTYRHMSMSVKREGRAPNEHAIWMIAQEFGFWGKFPEDIAHLWKEDLTDGGIAINILQPFAPPATN